MIRLKRFYFLPIILAILLGGLLVGFMFPTEYFVKAALLATVPALTIIIGFRIITQKRLKKFKGQLRQVLETLGEFDVDEPQKVEFEESPIPLFNELKENLVELIARIRTDYQANKQFTQNASHELQTPLSIIKGHAEILLQSPNVGEKEIASLALILQNANRLAKLNSALILLSKIENQRFTDDEPVNFNEIADEVMSNFKDLMEIQGLEVQKRHTSNFQVEMSATLAEILVANLFQNAIRHNTGRFIQLDTTESCFKISNPGEAPEMPINDLFKRFKRQSDKEESLGLGLSIIKRICEQSGLEVKYDFSTGLHIVSVLKSAQNRLGRPDI